MQVARRFFRYVPRIRLYLALNVIIGSILGVLVLFQALYLSQIITNVFLSSQSLSQVWPLLLALLITLLLRALVSGSKILMASQISGYLKREIRHKIHAHLFALGPAYARGERSGELVNTLVEGVEALDPYFSQYLPQVFLSVLVPAIVIIAICRIDLPSGIILLIMVPVLPFLLAIAGMMAGAETRRHWRTQSLLSAHFLDTLQGLTTLKLLGRSQEAEAQIREVSEQFRVTTMKTLRVAFFSSFLLEESATISAAIVAVEVGLRLLMGQFPLQTALLVLLLTPEFFLPLRLLGTKYHAGMTGSVALQRIVQILEMPVAAQSTSQPTAQRVSTEPRSERGICLTNVSYTYGRSHPALRDVSLRIAPGQRVALVGPSGAGKSTIVQLLLRFIEADSGQLSFDGILSTEMTPQEWRKKIAWVPQHPFLFHASIAENIRLGCPQATRAEMLQAARLAHADEFIERLPQAYDTVLGEQGVTLSGGEAQRLSLARALLKDAPLLILDEATSYLDAEHEALVLHALSNLRETRTVLMIAHRLSTVSDADEIIVVDNGKVVACGTHDALVQQAGMYRDLIATREPGR